MNNREPPIIWEEAEKIDDGQGHGAAIYYGSKGDLENSLPVAFLRDLKWLHSPSYNLVIEVLCSLSDEYSVRGLDGHSVFKEIQIAVFQYLQGSKPGGGYISEHLWIRING
jgi:hypothetical protein